MLGVTQTYGSMIMSAEPQCFLKAKAMILPGGLDEHFMIEVYSDKFIEEIRESSSALGKLFYMAKIQS